MKFRQNCHKLAIIGFTVEYQWYPRPDANQAWKFKGPYGISKAIMRPNSKCKQLCNKKVVCILIKYYWQVDHKRLQLCYGWKFRVKVSQRSEIRLWNHPLVLLFLYSRNANTEDSEDASCKVAWLTEHFRLWQLKCSEKHVTLHKANPGPYNLVCVRI